MLKFSRLACGLAVCVLLVAAYAHPIKIFSIIPVPGGPENSDADGMALLNYSPGLNGGVTIAHATLTGFTPDTCYGAEFFVYAPECELNNVAATIGPAHGLITNAAGNAHGESAGALGDVTCGGTACVDLSIWTDPNCDGNLSDGTLAATGTNCP